MRLRILAALVACISCGKTVGPGVFSSGTATIVNGAGSTVGIALPVSNPGSSAAASVTITSLQLGKARLIVPAALPLSVGEVPAKGSFTVAASFDGSGLKAGTSLPFTASGTYLLAKNTVKFALQAQVTLPAAPAYQAGSNTSDNLILEARAGGGDVIDYYGPKDASGLATGLSTVSIQAPSGEVISTDLDSSGHPLNLASTSGGVLHFEWSSATTAQVTATSADGGVVTIPVDVSQVAPPAQGFAGSIQRDAAPGPLIIHVDDCGSADDAVVGVHYLPVGARFGPVYPGRSLGGGDYSVALPAPQNSSETVSTLCEALSQSVEAVCTAAKILLFTCGALSASGVATAPAVACTLEAFHVFEACEINGGPTETEANLLKGACDLVATTIDYAAQNATVQLTPFATVNGVTQQPTFPVLVPAAGPFDKMTLSFPPAASFHFFKANPGAPPPGSGYVATAEVRCSRPNTNIVIDKHGADGDAEMICPAAQETATCSLAVGPAGPSGSIDTLTAQAIGSSDQTLHADLTVVRRPADLAVAPDSLSFAATKGGANPASQSIAVSSIDPSLTVTWTATVTAGNSWLSISPSTGTTPGAMAVSVSAEGLAAGSYSGSITIPAANRIVPVTLVVCTPDCAANGYDCGADGCGGSCGPCATRCVGGSRTTGGFCCQASCAGINCGPDSCGGGSCGTCGPGTSCVNGSCVAPCAANCNGISCGGPDGCNAGGICGCPAGFTCSLSGTCTCTPDCTATHDCGADGCGGSCGSCSTACVQGSCAPPSGGDAGVCGVQQVAGGDAADSRDIEMGVSAGTFDFTYDTFTIPDDITVSYQGTVLFDTGCVGASGSQTLSFGPGSSSKITVSVAPNCSGGTSGTAWQYTIGCPH